MQVDRTQILGLLLLAIPIACVARTVVFEEVFREAREFCERKSQHCSNLFTRKFFYLFTCEYCFSHYVTLFFIAITRYHLLFPDWRGYLIGFFALVFVANLYLNLYSRLRVDISSEKKEIEAKEKQIEKLETELCDRVAGRESNANAAQRKGRNGHENGLERAGESTVRDEPSKRRS
jgi:hypothetical protein